MSEAITIEIRGEAVGVVRPEANGFRFVAVKFDVWPLDGCSFATPDEAVAAATAAVGGECVECAR